VWVEQEHAFSRQPMLLNTGCDRTSTTVQLPKSQRMGFLLPICKKYKRWFIGLMLSPPLRNGINIMQITGTTSSVPGNTKLIIFQISAPSISPPLLLVN
jgi:hypothetical protein